MGHNKQQVLDELRAEYERWEALLASLSEAQIIDPRLPAGLSLKDVVAHLWAWQQRTVARAEAALHDRQPAYPQWPAHLDPHAEDDLEEINAWIYATNREKSWPRVYADWREGFQRLLAAAQDVDEKDMFEEERYAWLPGMTLAFILEASGEHHREEHYGPLTAWLRENGDIP
jgi:hypothetical protein